MRIAGWNQMGVLLVLAGAATGLAQEKIVRLYPGTAPGSESWTRTEAAYKSPDGLQMVRNVVEPGVTVYLPSPALATGTAVIIAPGGAFRFLSWEMEGTMVADWLKQRGVAAFVLRYRLSDTGTEEEFQKVQARPPVRPAPGAGRPAPPPGRTEIQAMAAADGLQAIRVVREHAAEWHISPDRIGIMGFSAGGYVAMKAALDYTPETRPDFAGSIYGCCFNGVEVKVPADAPAVFFLHAYNDPVADSSPVLFQAWKAAKRPSELHSYAAGGHGFGMLDRGLPTDRWIERFGDWLRYQKLMK